MRRTRRPLICFTGLPADEMAERITGNYERALTITVNDIEHIESQSLTGIAVVKTYFQPVYRRVGELLHKGIAEGEFRQVDPVHFVPSMVAMIVFYFSSAPVMQRIVRFNPLAPERIAERRAAVLDFISAALFQSRASVGPAVRQSGVRK